MADVLGDLLREGKNNCPGRNALVWRDQEYSYFTLDALADQVAYGLEKLGVEPRDRIALYMHNIPEFVVAFYAITRLGAVAVPINIFWRDKDLIYLLQQSRVSGVITVAPLHDQVRQAQIMLPEIEWIVAVAGNNPQPENSVAWQELTRRSETDPVQYEVDPSEPAVIAFTGGRTGPSKPAMLSHFNLLTNCNQMQDLSQLNFLNEFASSQDLIEDLLDEVPGVSRYEISLIPAPLFNLFNLNIGLNLTTMMHGTTVLMEKFDPDAALQQIEHYKCTLLFGTPAIFGELVASPKFKEANLSSLRYVFSYGGPLPTAVESAWRTKTRKPIYNCYGAAEAAPVICCEAGTQAISSNSVGPALPFVQMYVMDNTGKELPHERLGEIYVKGPNLMLGYFNPQAPDQPFVGKVDGWFRTEDLGLVDKGGNFHILDRREDALVLSNGKMLLPRDVEDALCNHPGVWQACALPYAVRDGSVQMVAFVIPNEAGRTMTEPQLMNYCGRHLDAMELPTRIFIFREPDFPRLPNGAPWRRALRQYVAAYL